MSKMDDPVVAFGVFAVYLLILGIGGIIADYVLPHIRPLNRWIDSLPEYEDDSEIYRREMERIRHNREARQRRIKEMIGRFRKDVS